MAEPQFNKMPGTGMTVLLAAACGISVANIYYAQPLVGLIAPSLKMAPGIASFIVTLTQLGYAAGLLFLVPLGDMVENRRLVLLTVAAGIPALLMVALAPSATVFLLAAALVGMAAASAQMLVPLAAHLAPEASRGRVVGNVMSGLVLGILLARPAASLVAAAFGWRAVFIISAAAVSGMVVVLRRALPRRVPAPPQDYGDILASSLSLPFTHTVLRQRALVQAAVFSGFTLFWTAAPLLLTARFGFHQSGIAVFALIGAAGAVTAPLTGRLADKGYGETGTAVALLVIAAAFLLAGWGGLAGHSVVALAAAGIIIDGGAQVTLGFSQRRLYTLHPAIRSRLNGVFMTIAFLGGAFGSAVTSPILVCFGWAGICAAGIVLLLAASIYFQLTKSRVSSS